MTRTRQEPTPPSAMLSGLKAGAITGLLGAAAYAFFIFKTGYSDSILNYLYAYYAHNYSGTSTPVLTQSQFANAELFFFAIAPMVVGVPVGPFAALLLGKMHLRSRKGKVQPIVALTTYCVAEVLYGYLLLPAAYDITFLEAWTSVSFFTALPFGYVFSRYSS